MHDKGQRVKPETRQNQIRKRSGSEAWENWLGHTAMGNVESAPGDIFRPFFRESILQSRIQAQ